MFTDVAISSTPQVARYDWTAESEPNHLNEMMTAALDTL